MGQQGLLHHLPCQWHFSTEDVLTLPGSVEVYLLLVVAALYDRMDGLKAASEANEAGGGGGRSLSEEAADEEPQDSNVPADTVGILPV